jgi:hypothetical protein
VEDFFCTEVPHPKPTVCNLFLKGDVLRSSGAR